MSCVCHVLPNLDFGVTLEEAGAKSLSWSGEMMLHYSRAYDRLESSLGDHRLNYMLDNRLHNSVKHRWTYESLMDGRQKHVTLVLALVLLGGTLDQFID